MLVLTCTGFFYDLHSCVSLRILGIDKRGTSSVRSGPSEAALSMILYYCDSSMEIEILTILGVMKTVFIEDPPQSSQTL